MEFLMNATGKKMRWQLVWDYTPEKVKTPISMNRGEGAGHPGGEGDQPESNARFHLQSPLMAASPAALDFLSADSSAPAATENPQLLGMKTSFLPSLGKATWSWENEKW